MARNCASPIRWWVAWLWGRWHETKSDAASMASSGCSSTPRAGGLEVDPVEADAAANQDLAAAHGRERRGVVDAAPGDDRVGFGDRGAQGSRVGRLHEPILDAGLLEGLLLPAGCLGDAVRVD